MESITLIAAGWGSGINAYLTVLILGVSGRFGWVDAPGSMEQMWVLAVAGVLFVAEFVVDKVPYLDNAWDGIHTVVRPSVAAALGVAIAGADLGDWQAAAAGAGLALAGHAGKATTRLAINASPEPFSNIVTSAVEDLSVLAVVGLAVEYPEIAAVIAVVLLVAGLVLTVVTYRLVRRGWRALGRRFGAAAADRPPVSH